MPLAKRPERTLLATAMVVLLATVACGEKTPVVTTGPGSTGLGSTCDATLILRVVGSELSDTIRASLTTSAGVPVGGVVVKWLGGGAVPGTSTTGPDGIAYTRLPGIQTRPAGSVAGVLAVVACLDPVGFIFQPARPGPAAAIRVLSGQGQSGTPGQVLAGHLRVQVVDPFENEMPNTTVRWTYAVAGDSGTVAPAGTDSVRVSGSGEGATATAFARTDSLGVATAVWTLGPTALAGTHAVRVSAPGVTTVRFTASVAVPGPSPAGPSNRNDRP